MFSCIHIRGMTWQSRTFQVLAFKSSFVALAVCFGSLSYCWMMRHSRSFEAFA
uniref:Uncharacterized protein n=1 Tax=Anguilla anguilla TaxID=7936 RepID=A0A0E9QWB1_ANGAN